MARANSSDYGIASTPHAQATSTATNDTKTLSRPSNAIACYLTVSTTAARVTFDSTTPTSSNGLVLQTNVLHFFSVSSDIKFTSTAAANSIVDILWLT